MLKVSKCVIKVENNKPRYKGHPSITAKMCLPDGVRYIGVPLYTSNSVVLSRLLAIVKLMQFICENSGDSLQKTMIERERGNYSDV